MGPEARRPAVFLDRDGVINEDTGYVHRPDQFRVLPGVVEALRILRKEGLPLVLVTNQAGIARGLYDVPQFHALTAHMLELFGSQGIEFEGVFFCPHHPSGSVRQYAVACACRKPAAGMLFDAARRHGIALESSFLVGDKQSDIEAGRAAGLRANILLGSGHENETGRHGADFHAADLPAAAEWIRDRISRPHG